jgi:type IV pilus assembly protein PilA
MFQRLRHRAQGQEGFTLIELLVVILIIGILAAVAIPAFLNQKGKANDATSKSDATTAQTAEETYFTDNQAYTNITANLTTIEPALNQAILTVAGGGDLLTADVPAAGLYGATAGVAASTDNYDINVTSKSNVLFAITRNSNGTINRTCQVPANQANTAGCKNVVGVVTAARNGTW